jgi:hypothetical protein
VRFPSHRVKILLDMEKAGQRWSTLTGFSIFGEPFGSPIPQRPQPLDIPLRVGEIIHGSPFPAYTCRMVFSLYIVSIRRPSANLSYRGAESSFDMRLFLSYAKQVFTLLRRLYLLMHQALERCLSVF